MLTVLSLALSTFFFWYGGTQYVGGSGTFFAWAEIIGTDRQLSAAQGARAAGYPLLIWATGWKLTHSILPLLLLHALAAFAMPLLIYWLLEKRSKIIAFLSGLALMLTLLPYTLMKFIHHDQLHIFLVLAAVVVLCKYALDRRGILLFLAVLIAFAAELVRPASTLFAVAVLLMAFVLDVWPGRQTLSWLKVALRYGLGAMIVIVLSVANQVHRDAVFGTNAKEASYTGAQLFYGAYVSSTEFGVRITPTEGPHTANVFRIIGEIVGEDPAESLAVRAFTDPAPAGSEFSYANFPKYSREAFIAEIFDHPNLTYHSMFTMPWYEHPGFGEEMARASIEIFSNHPELLFGVLGRNLSSFFVAPGFGHSMFNRVPFHQQANYFFLSYPSAGSSALEMPIPARSEIAASSFDASPDWVTPLFAQLDRHFVTNYVGISQTTFWTGLAGLVLSTLVLFGCVVPRLREKLAGELLAIAAAQVACAGAILYHAVVVVLSAEPFYRYHHIVVPLQIAACGLTGLLLASLLRAFVKLRGQGGSAVLQSPV